MVGKPYHTEQYKIVPNIAAREKPHVYIVPAYFGQEHSGKVDVTFIIRCGLVTSGTTWRLYFQQALLGMGFKPSYADPDIYMKPDTILEDGGTQTQIYLYIIVYVDDLFSISSYPGFYMKDNVNIFRLNPDIIIEPNLYMSATITA